MQTLRFDGARLIQRPALADTEISLAAFQAGARPEGGRFALALPNSQAPEQLGADLHRFATIVLEFPVFRDGRAYSQARILREQLGFRGEIRARGDILRDQIDFMIRCGFDAFEVAADAADEASASVGEIGHVYQPAADNRAPAWRARRARAAA